MPQEAPRRQDYAHFKCHTTRWNDNDVYGHLNNTIHYALFDSTVNDWLIGRGLLVPGRSVTIAVVAETGCRFLSELAYPSEITAGLRVARIGGSSVRYELALFGDQADQAAAMGFFVHVHVDAVTRRPCPIPDATRAALTGLLWPQPERGA